MGNILGYLIVLISIVVGLAFDSVTGGTAFVIIAYLVTPLILVGYYLAMPSKDLSSYRAMSAHLSSEFRTYHFQIRTPGAGVMFSALINCLRIAGIIWGILLVIKGYHVVGGFALALMPLTSLYVVRFEPYRYLTPGVSAGNRVASEQLDLIERVTVCYRQHHNVDERQSGN